MSKKNIEKNLKKFVKILQKNTNKLLKMFDISLKLLKTVYIIKFVAMKTNRTFSMLKPDSIEDGYMLPILNKINDSGFKIIALKYKKMKRGEAEEFYSIHCLEVS